MIVEFISIALIYGLSAALVHFAYYLTRIRLNHANRAETTVRNPVPDPYVLISDHSQHQIEWGIRLLQLYSWMQGKPVRIYVLDKGSGDDTLKIADCFMRRNVVQILPNEAVASLHETKANLTAAEAVQMYRATTDAGHATPAPDAELLEHATVIDLNRREDWHKIPLY